MAIAQNIERSPNAGEKLSSPTQSTMSTPIKLQNDPENVPTSTE